MEPRVTLITLGVDDLERAVTFYRDVVGWAPASIVEVARNPFWPVREDGRIDFPRD